MPVRVVPTPDFEVHGPIDVPLMKDAKHLAIDSPSAKKKIGNGTWGDRRGCYVFAIKGRGAPCPWYVGKAAKTTFASEVFTDSNCKKYAEAIALVGSGKLQVYLISAPEGRGRVNESAIDLLETRLIEACAGVNSRIRNRRKNIVRELRIAGVMNARQGRPSQAARAMKQMMGLD